MTKAIPVLALLVVSTLMPSAVPDASATPPSGPYQRVVLVSWDGTQRDVLFDLLEKTDPSVPCWQGGSVYPVETGRVNSGGAPIYTCLPALGGGVPQDAPEGSPSYGAFQMIASHTTNDGATMTKPQHASMLTGMNCETHGLVGNVTKGNVPEGSTIYEILMNQFDPLDAEGERNGFIFRTHSTSDRKYVGKAIYNYAYRSGALQIATGHGSSNSYSPGPLLHAGRTFERWKQDEITLGLPETDFFMFLHFKAPDWGGHKNGDGHPAYRRIITETDRKLYTLMEMLEQYGWGDAAILVTTDHGFHKDHHHRDSGRDSFNTFLAAHNVTLTTDHIPLRTPADYCASQSNPTLCMTAGPEEPMPARDVVPNVYVTSVTPTLLDMFGVEWRGSTGIEGVSLYVP